MLPFEPEDVKTMRDRVHRALDRLFDCRGKRGVAKPTDDIPEKYRRHVFDFQSGDVQVRFVLNRELVDTSAGPKALVALSVTKPTGENINGFCFIFGFFIRSLVGDLLDGHLFAGHVESGGELCFYFEPQL